MLATGIDYAIYFLLFYIYIYCFGTRDDDGNMQVVNLMAVPLIIIWFAYFVVLEAVNQATPGHDILQLKVVKSDGERIGFTNALKRRMVDLIDIGIYGIPALICICNTPKFQRLGDLWADTVVIKKADIILTEVNFKE